MNLNCFKAYDVRGVVGDDFDQNLAYQIAVSFQRVLNCKKVVISQDTRPSSSSIAKSAIDGLLEQGADVLDIGVAGTEEMYWAVSAFKACGGIQITASHNPIEYNGMKFVKAKSIPLDPIVEFKSIKTLVENFDFPVIKQKGFLQNVHYRARELFLKKVLSFVDFKNLKPLKVLINCGNGAAGPTIEALINKINQHTDMITFQKLFFEPDPSFPNGVPNPLIKGNQLVTSNAVLKTASDLGVAFDGDFDRCFFFDNEGRFVNGEYIVSMFAKTYLSSKKPHKIVHDPRVVWLIKDTIMSLDGLPIVSKTGHAFIKEKMRMHDAIYGGEMSAHHYFKDFAYCDSGIIPFLMMCQILSNSNDSFSSIHNSMREIFLSSGEINLKVSNPKNSLENIQERYSSEAQKIDALDGLSIEFEDWRFNLRSSNTEPLLRLNIETRGDPNLLEIKRAELENILKCD